MKLFAALLAVVSASLIFPASVNSAIPVHLDRTIKISPSEPRQLYEQLAIDINGNIYLTDTGLHRIILINQSGQIIKQAGGFGWGPEQFHHPSGICARSGLDVYAADRNNHRIHRYDRHLNFIQFIEPNKGLFSNIDFGYPADAGMTSLNELIIIDHENNRAIKFGADLEPAAIFGGHEPGPGRLKTPDRLCVSQKDQVFISEKQAPRIVVFDEFGNYLYEIQYPGFEEVGSITWFDPHFILVCDIKRNKVFVMTEKGTAAAILLLPEKKYVDAAVYQNRFYFLNQQENTIEIYTIDMDRIKQIK